MNRLVEISLTKGYEMDEERYFRARWGKILKIISTFISIFLLGIFSAIAFSDRTSTVTVMVLYLAIPLLIIFVSLLFIVRGYTVSDNTLRIKRLLWNTNIDISMLSAVECDPKAMTGSIRTFGNGGLFSFSGRYRSTKLGSFKAYVTDFKNCVVIEASGQTTVVSPEDAELFREVLMQRQWSK